MRPCARTNTTDARGSSLRQRKGASKSRRSRQRADSKQESAGAHSDGDGRRKPGARQKSNAWANTPFAGAHCDRPEMKLTAESRRKTNMCAGAHGDGRQEPDSRQKTEEHCVVMCAGEYDVRGRSLREGERDNDRTDMKQAPRASSEHPCLRMGGYGTRGCGHSGR